MSVSPEVVPAEEEVAERFQANHPCDPLFIVTSAPDSEVILIYITLVTGSGLLTRFTCDLTGRLVW